MKYGFAAYWKRPQETTYINLVTALNHPPVLALFDEDKPMSVKNDASHICMGASLMHKDDHGTWHPVENGSKKFNSAQ